MPATAPLRHLKECRKGKCNTGEIPHATLRKSLCIFEEKVLAKNIKALHFEKDGFCLYYKRLDDGRFQWPRDSSEVRNLSRQEYRWLLEGLSIDQPKAIRPARKKDF